MAKKQMIKEWQAKKKIQGFIYLLVLKTLLVVKEAFSWNFLICSFLLVETKLPSVSGQVGKKQIFTYITYLETNTLLLRASKDNRVVFCRLSSN